MSQTVTLQRFHRRITSIAQLGRPALSLLLKQHFPDTNILMEWCFYVEFSTSPTSAEQAIIANLLDETYEPRGLREVSWLPEHHTTIEVVPRLSFATPWGSTTLSIFESCGVTSVVRIERGYQLWLDTTVTPDQRRLIENAMHDRMTQMVIETPLTSFSSGHTATPMRIVRLIEDGLPALQAANTEWGLAMSDYDLAKIYHLFAEELGYNPSELMLQQWSTANSEHTRHPFFRGPLRLDGRDLGYSLMQLIKRPLSTNPSNSRIAMDDDSSAITGFDVTRLVRGSSRLFPAGIGPSRMELMTTRWNPSATAETHNHPTLIEPYAGAATGEGGKQRDEHCIRCGGLMLGSGVGYCVGILSHPEINLPWLPGMEPNTTHASAIEILLRGSDGASDYCNCSGQPLVNGFVRSGELLLPTQTGYETVAWAKPVLYTFGTGLVDDNHPEPALADPDLVILLLGGPAYSIGVGGGNASSLMGGANTADLEHDSVQRGDPEMAQRLRRVIEACVNLSDRNPIRAIHDLGAGGASNALPEIAEPYGALIWFDEIPVGDRTMSLVARLINESQERDTILVHPDDLELILAICDRYNLPAAVVGKTTEDRRYVVTTHDDTPLIDLDMSTLLGSHDLAPVELTTVPRVPVPLKSTLSLSVWEAILAVLQHPDVASKNYLTSKGDRSVGGLSAQQQCVGPFQLPLADYAVLAHSHFDTKGTAISLGEQPWKMEVSPAAGARMALAESLFNLVGAGIGSLQDIKHQANWMWAAKLPGEGARLLKAAEALVEMMVTLGLAIDGGKDSLSMAVKRAIGEIVRAPGQLVMAAYAPMVDVSRKVTPELKSSGNQLIHIYQGGDKARLGGSVLARTQGELGDESPDVDDIAMIGRIFAAVQELIAKRLIVSSHDVSDGGLFTTLAEMAFASEFGLNVSWETGQDPLASLFAEELGVVVEYTSEEVAQVIRILEHHQVAFRYLGEVTEEPSVRITLNGDVIVDTKTLALRGIWDRTSSQLQLLQISSECAASESEVIKTLTLTPQWRLTYDPGLLLPKTLRRLENPPRAAVVCEEGSNGDAEMRAALYLAGFEVWEITMSDLTTGRIDLKPFQLLVFPGGFAYADVLDSARGWAAKFRYNDRLRQVLKDFTDRSDTLVLGICNGCQVMSLLGLVDIGTPGEDTHRPRFVGNASGRFESRFVNVTILDSPSVFLKGMAGSTLGVWAANGEGRAHNLKYVPTEYQCLRYVDNAGSITETYPFNPNGSPNGTAGICSTDGRNLAFMLHLERQANAMWQWPWLPKEFRDLSISPWLLPFVNAFEWCLSH